jgi:alpha 1,2-mannosyltransferase
MRYKLRITRSLALTCFLLALLCFFSRHYGFEFYTLPASLTSFTSFHSDVTAKVDSAAFARDIQTLWSHWSQIFHDARPLCEHIVLSSNAQIVSVSPSDTHSREAPTNRIASPDSDIESIRAAHESFLGTLRVEEDAGGIFDGVGIVTVGGGEYFGPAIIGIHMLRKTGCTLPVEIFVADEGEYESQLCEEYLPTLGATCLVLSRFLKGRNSAHTFKVTHYQLKSLAMLFSSFAEILYLDSDSIPLVDPSKELFSSEPYKSNGLVVWPDFWIATESPLFYTIAGLPSFPSNLPKSSSEAGQLLINKKTHLKTLLLAIYYNIYGPDYYYPLLSQGVLGQGDKETFMAAALVVEEPYYRVKTGVSSVGRDNGEEHKGSGMIQYHPSDDFLFAASGNISAISNAQVRPAFAHANTPKMNAGHLVDEGDLFSTSQQRLRLWGTRESQEKLFGVDLEKVVWELLLKTGCELELVIREWKGRDRMCKRLEDHWKELF